MLVWRRDHRCCSRLAHDSLAAVYWQTLRSSGIWMAQAFWELSKRRKELQLPVCSAEMICCKAGPCLREHAVNQC